MHCLTNDAIFPKWYSVQEHYYTNDTTYIDTKGLMVLFFPLLFECFVFLFFCHRDAKRKQKRTELIANKQDIRQKKTRAYSQRTNQTNSDTARTGSILCCTIHRFFRIFRLVVKIVLASTIFFVI